MIKDSYMGVFIRDYLKENGEAYVYEMYKAYREFCEKKGRKGLSYQSFRVVLYAARQLGLIELSRVENEGKFHAKMYYRLAENAENDERWGRVMQAYLEQISQQTG